MTENNPVRPRNAASLVILRGHGPDAEVLLGRREPRHRFMPNVFVFPGGRLDSEDGSTAVSSAMKPTVARLLERQASPRRARGLGVAAIRETFEETGLCFGDVDDDRIRPSLGTLDYIARAITPPRNPIRFHARFFIANLDDATGELKGNGELLDLHWLPLAKAFELPIVDVTEFVLTEVQRRLAGIDAPGLPLFSYRHGRAAINYQ